MSRLAFFVDGPRHGMILALQESRETVEFPIITPESLSVGIKNARYKRVVVLPEYGEDAGRFKYIYVYKGLYG